MSIKPRVPCVSVTWHCLFYTKCGQVAVSMHDLLIQKSTWDQWVRSQKAWILVIASVREAQIRIHMWRHFETCKSPYDGRASKCQRTLMEKIWMWYVASMTIAYAYRQCYASHVWFLLNTGLYLIFTAGQSTQGIRLLRLFSLQTRILKRRV